MCKHDCPDQNLRFSLPVHVFWWQTKQANEDAASKLRIKLGLIINDMDKALDQIELHMEVGEVCRNAAFQTLKVNASSTWHSHACSAKRRPLTVSQGLNMIAKKPRLNFKPNQSITVCCSTQDAEVGNKLINALLFQKRSTFCACSCKAIWLIWSMALIHNVWQVTCTHSQTFAQSQCHAATTTSDNAHASLTCLHVLRVLESCGAPNIPCR